MLHSLDLPVSPQAAGPGADPRPTGELVRGIGIWGLISANVLNMIGVGPFLTIPLALAAMGGPQAMLGWVLGAIVALCDGLVWAELGSRVPNSGGPYFYLLEAFGRRSYGRVIATIFLWQSLLAGPLTVASGAVGFADYAGVFHRFPPWQLKTIAMALCLANLALLYRSIRSISVLSIVVTIVVLITCVWIIVSGALHFHASLIEFPAGAFRLNHAFWLGLGSATLIATYDYGGYNNACLLGGEVIHPRRNIPRAVIVSILLVAALYLSMNTAILGVVPWRLGIHSTTIVSDFMQTMYHGWATHLVAALILVASAGSVFANLLGYSRIPYAAAKDGTFLAVFARVHPAGHFPTVSLIYMGVASALMCLVSLGDLISILIVVQTTTQFMAQCIAVMLLRRRDVGGQQAFRMPWFPLPALVALLGWFFVTITSGLRNIAIAAALIVLALVVYLYQSSREKVWPFQTA